MKYMIFWHDPDDYEILPADSERAQKLSFAEEVGRSLPMALDEAKATIRHVLNVRIGRLRAEINRIDRLSPDSFKEKT